MSCLDTAKAFTGECRRNAMRTMTKLTIEIEQLCCEIKDGH